MDRRRFPRAGYQCLITIGKKGGKKDFLTNTENIGVGGICVILDDNLGLFTKVELELMLKDEKPPIKCKGSIMWVIKKSELSDGKPVTKFDTGVEFVGITDADRERIEKIVKYITEAKLKKEKGDK